MKRRSTKRKEEEEKKKKSRSLTNLNIRSWADLDLNMLGEIKKKLYWGDHARFSGVCKSWLAAEHEKRACDVLPWAMLLFPPPDVRKVAYNLYQPLDLNQPTLSRCFHLNQFFDLSRIRVGVSTLYRDGCLLLSMLDNDNTRTHFLLVSILADTAATLPEFVHPDIPFQLSTINMKAVSTYPFHPDCVFLALHASDHHNWSIGIFRHGDKEWTTTHFHFEEPFAHPYSSTAVFIRGVFYFLCYDQRLVSYELDSGELKVRSFSTTSLCYGGIGQFFQLDGELMIFYYDMNVRKCFLLSYDWSENLWIPLQSLGNRSLFLSSYSVYVDAINNYEESRNKIYYLKDGTCVVYSFENGELVKSKSSGLRYWDALKYTSQCSFWVEPLDLLPI